MKKKVYIELKGWKCSFCRKIEEGTTPSLPLCKLCINAWKELVLEKREKKFSPIHTHPAGSQCADCSLTNQSG